MKKELLFIINNLNIGGAEKALISLLQSIDYKHYNVDLFLIKKEGNFLKQVPEQVRILKPSKYFNYFDMSIKQAIWENLKAFRFGIIYNRIMAGFTSKTEKNLAIREQKMWRYLKNVMLSLEKEYDVAIGYLEKTPNYFCVDKVKAHKKIGFIHNDYQKLGMDKELDEPYFKKLDHVLTVSESCKTSLDNTFPELKERFGVMYNIVSPKLINELAKEETDVVFKENSLLTLGRLNYQKGYDIAIEACKILVDKGLQIHWYILGEGAEKNNLLRKIKEYGLDGNFTFFGLRDNPYPYMKAADIYVQPSRFEGKSIALDEAKILCKPIIATNFSTVKDQLADKVNSLIAEIDANSLAEKIEKLLADKSLQESFKENLCKEYYGTESEIEKLYKLIES